MALDYGTCPCTGNYERRSVEIRMTVEGKVIIFDKVPQGACRQCGSRVYKIDMLEYIESMMKSRRVTIKLD